MTRLAFNRSTLMALALLTEGEVLRQLAEAEQPAQTNAVDPDVRPEPPASRQVRRQMERLAAKGRARA